MNSYKSLTELKSLARAHMLGNYGATVGALMVTHVTVFAVMSLLSSFIPNNFIGSLLNVIIYLLVSLLSGIFSAGSGYLYLNIVSGRPGRADYVFYSFRNNPEKAVTIQAIIIVKNIVVSIPFILCMAAQTMVNNPIIYIFIVLSGLFMIVGCIYIMLTYMLAFFLVHDFPQYSVKQVMLTSRNIMQKHLKRALYMYISFIPLSLLSILSLGIGSLWVDSYKNATYAEFFMDIMKTDNK